MNVFDLAAILITVAAISGYLNHRLLRLPPASGTLAVALVSSLIALAVDRLVPELRVEADIARFLSQIDFNETLMRGLLSFLLFAGALHLDLDALLDNRWTIGALATVGVLVSTAIVGGVMWLVFALLGTATPLLVCLVFGALISPTDPVAVIGLLKELRGSRSLEAQIAGEALFNDGVAVVIFMALVSLAGLSGGAHTSVQADVWVLATFFAREVAGGAALGLTFGYLGYRAMKSVDYHPLELLITIALVMSTYALSFRIHVSGPIAVVVAGLLIGNPGRRFAMSDRTRERVDAFWSMMDEILNAVLFLLIGLEVFTISGGPRTFGAALLSIPVTLLGRLISVAIPAAAMKLRGQFRRGLVPLLTWSGLRGGISVAMVLSLPRFPARDLLIACTYAVVVFSILVQGLTVRRVLEYYGVGGSRSGV